AWASALKRPASVGMAVRDGGPTALLLSRQNLPFVARDESTVAAIARGGYVLRDAENPRAVIIATGSEVALALQAQQQLAERGVAVRVVSMPCTELFDAQDAEWRESVLPKGLPRVAVEAGATAGWYKYVGLEGAVIGIDSFGESAPADQLFKHIGRNILRAHYEGGKKHDIEIVAINDLGAPKTNAHLTQYDTAHGRFPGTVGVDGDYMVVNGDRIRVLANRDPSALPWGELNVD